MRGIPVLMYHALEDGAHPAGARDAGEQLYVLPVHQFREQMEWLQREGYRTFLLDELLAQSELPENAVVLTFDDGHESDYTLALPILQEFGFKAEFFITTGWIGTAYFMGEEQIRGLHRAGMGIGSHGVTHRFLSDLASEDFTNELRDSMKVLSNIVGGRINTFSYPGGRMNAQTTSQASATGYRFICSSEPCRYNAVASRKTIPRFAISHQTSQKDFSSLLSGEGGTLLSLRYIALSSVKAMLGNKRYEALRAALLGTNSNSHSAEGAR